MLIFHSYVSLPEGNMIDPWNFQNMACQNRGKFPFFLRLGSERRQRAAPVEAALGAVELLLVETDVFLR